MKTYSKVKQCEELRADQKQKLQLQTFNNNYKKNENIKNTKKQTRI